MIDYQAIKVQQRFINFQELAEGLWGKFPLLVHLRYISFTIWLLEINWISMIRLQKLYAWEWSIDFLQPRPKIMRCIYEKQSLEIFFFDEQWQTPTSAKPHCRCTGRQKTLLRPAARNCVTVWKVVNVIWRVTPQLKILFIILNKFISIVKYIEVYEETLAAHKKATSFVAKLVDNV